MRNLIQPWLCYLSLFALAAFSFISGVILELGVRFSAFALLGYGNKPLPEATQWFLALHTEYTHSLFTLAFYPTIAASAYLFFLLRRVRDERERCARFALVAFTSLTAILSFLVFGTLSLALPFFSLSGGMLTRPEPPTPFLQQMVWIGLLVLLSFSALLFVALLRSLRREKREGEVGL